MRTKVTTSQNRNEHRHGTAAGGQRIADSVTRLVEAAHRDASVTIGVPIAPHATGAVLANRFSTAAWNGEKPRPTMTAPAMATGVPKPDVPSMTAPNENAIRMTLDACRFRARCG